MKNRKMYITVLILLAIAALIVLLLTNRNRMPEAEIKETTVDLTAKEPEVTELAAEEPLQTEAPAETEEKPQEAEQPFLVQISEDDPSIAYVLVRMSNSAGLLPLPMEGEYTRTIRQYGGDGSEVYNTLHLTPNGFWMEDSNCEGQDCVNMGEVTLENREERVLWNMVICLPHQLSAELITREEALKMLKQ